MNAERALRDIAGVLIRHGVSPDRHRHGPMNVTYGSRRGRRQPERHQVVVSVWDEWEVVIEASPTGSYVNVTAYAFNGANRVKVKREVPR